MYQRILADPLLFPQDMPHDAMTLITGLLQRDPTKRLGANGAEEIKRHPFFSKHIDWNRFVESLLCPVPLSYSTVRTCTDGSFASSSRLMAKKIQPPFKPTVVRTMIHLIIISANDLPPNPPRIFNLQESVLDTANFDAEFTGEKPQDSHVDETPLSETVQDQFRGFTYNPGNEYLSESVSYPSVMG